jgi:membrane protein DedA with SNARE-associated domain/rhodanese-related sulfurtransferase
MFLSHAIDRFGTAIVFVNALVSALGIPVPIMPTLVIVGATLLTSADSAGVQVPLHYAIALSAAVAGGLIGDFVWFQGGRIYGGQTLKTICQLSLSRDTCVKKTERFFGKFGVRVLFIAKFVPGLSLVSVPLAGTMGVRTRSFLAHDAVGIALYAVLGLTLGTAFANQVESLFRVMSHLGRQAAFIVVLALACYIAYRYWRRRTLLATLEKARMSVDELYTLMQSGKPPVVLDIRSGEKRYLDPYTIPGSIHTDERAWVSAVSELEPDTSIVIFCSCPNEVSAAWLAKTMRTAGYQKSIPLTGGIDAWRAAGFSLAPAFVAGASSSSGDEADVCGWSPR